VRPLPAIPLLLLCLTAVGQELRDSGYGDDSLVDPSGQYYYLQPNGSYMDVYGSTYQPLGDGRYTDALGNLLDAGPAAAGREPAGQPPPDTGPMPDASTPAGQAHDWASDDPLHSAAPVNGARAARPAPGGTDPDTVQPKNDAEFGSRYLEDVGDGYLRIDPREIAADPRLAKPDAPPERADKKAGQARPAKAFDASELDFLRPEPYREGPSADPHPQDLSPRDPGARTRWRPESERTP